MHDHSPRALDLQRPARPASPRPARRRPRRAHRSVCARPRRCNRIPPRRPSPGPCGQQLGRYRTCGLSATRAVIGNRGGLGGPPHPHTWRGLMRRTHLAACCRHRRPRSPRRPPRSPSPRTSTRRGWSAWSPSRGSPSTRRRCRRIADLNGGTPHTRTPGYTASAAYVKATLEKAGYEARYEMFNMPEWRETARAGPPAHLAVEQDLQAGHARPTTARRTSTSSRSSTRRRRRCPARSSRSATRRSRPTAAARAAASRPITRPRSRARSR